MHGPVDETIAADAANDAEIVASTVRPDDFVAAVAAARFGTAPPRYRRINVDAQLDRLHDPVYFTLRRGGVAIGTYCIDRQRLQLADSQLDAAYRGVLSIAEGHQRSGLGGWLVRSSLAWLRRQPGVALCYGCIDASNRRALGLLAREGALPLGELGVYTLYRQFPRRHMPLEKMGPDAAADIEALLATAAGGVELADRRLPTGGGSYRVARQRGEIVAGAHVSVTRLELDRLTGASGFVIERLMPHFAPGRRRFDPRNFAYLRLNHLYAPAPHAGVWPRFIQTLMAEHGVHFAVLVLDARGATFATLRQAGLPGAFSRRVAQRITVLSAGVEADPVLLARVQSAPLAISARDL